MGQVPDVLFLSEKLPAKARMTGFVDRNAPKFQFRDSFREVMPVSKKYPHFDHAAVGPIPRPATLAIQNMLTITKKTSIVW